MRTREDHSAGVIVFRRDGDTLRVLLLRSRLTRRPLWEFPKGGINEGESARAAALRELREETGLSRRQVRFVRGFRHTESYRFAVGRGADRTVVHKDVTYFLAETSETSIRIAREEASEFAWLSLREALRRVRYPARRALLRSAVKAAREAPAGKPPPESP